MQDEAATASAPETMTLETRMFGREVRWRYSDHWFGWSVFILRIVMGWTMLWAGIDKLVEPLRGNPKWTASGYLNFAIADENPLKEMFVSMDGAAIDFLVPWGLFLTGLCLLLGLFTRFAAFWAFAIMAFFWASAFVGPWFQMEHGWFVDDHMVYMVLFFGLGAFGAGRILGVDRWLERQPFVQKNRWLNWLLG